MIINQLSIFVGNRPGRLAEITQLFSDNDIDLRALSIADSADFGVLRVIVLNDRDYAKTISVLRTHNITVVLTEVLAIRLPDKPGALNKMLRLLAEKEISVEYLYAFVTPIPENSACVVVRVEDGKNNCAKEILEKNGYMGVMGI